MSERSPTYKATALVKARKIPDYAVVSIANSERQALLGLSELLHEEIRLGIEAVEIIMKVEEQK